MYRYTINNHNFNYLGILKVYPLLTEQLRPPTSTTLGSALCHPSRNQLGLLHSWFHNRTFTPAWSSGERTGG